MASESESIPLTKADDLKSLAEYFGVPECNENDVPVFFSDILARSISESIEYAISESVQSVLS